MAVYNTSSLKLNEIPANLQSGVLALKWLEETKKTPNPIMVHLSIDRKGYYLICVNKMKKEIECFDIALIHDTRTGTQVSIPQNVEYSNQRFFGALDVPLALKWLTIYYGNTFVPSSDLRIIHFCFESQDIAREWTDQLFRYGHNLYLRNLSSLECLEKIYSKIIHSLIDLDKHTISVRSLIQFLCKNPRDINKETRICQALDSVELPCQTNSAINPSQFTFNVFFRFYKYLMERYEVQKLFNSSGGKQRSYLNWENMKIFLKKQNDEHTDACEMGYYEQKAKDLIKKYTNDEYYKEKGMCDESFLRYLLSFDNLIIDPTKLELFMNMDKPLAHYFISSSHNTYLTGSQLTGRASIEMYRQVLLTGCRCIELDVVDSERRSDEPEIKHKNTPVKPILFIKVLVAIREYAFKVTSYPLILSIENHCSPKAQAKMAQYFIDIFGEYLITEPLRTHPCEENHPLPSPNDLKYKILIKNKKLNPKTTIKTTNQNIPPISLPKPGTISATSSSSLSTVSSSPTQSSNLSDESYRHDQTRTKRLSLLETHLELLNNNPRHGILIEDEDCSDDDLPLNEINLVSNQSSNIDTLRESKATKAMSDLVHYVVPTRFISFTHAEERNRSFEMSSFSEDKAQNLIRTSAKEFLAYNQRQLSRIYPRGTRIESSNYNPYTFWRIGCQMVALNYQTLDIPMQLNLSLFSFNGACGYIEKPSALCQSKSLFDPRAQKHVENVVGYEIDLKIISGQFLCQDHEPTFVDIQIYGMYGDIIKRYEYHVRIKQWNGFQAIYDDKDINLNEFVIRSLKIILPEMAAIRFVVSSDDGAFIGQCFIPIIYLRSGYRHISLRNQINIPVNSSSLFVFIRKNILINSKDEDFVDKLVQPLLNLCTTVNKSEIDCNNKETSYEDLSSITLVRNHSSLTNELDNNDRQRKISTFLNETNWYQKHLITTSKLQDTQNLCKVLSLNDVEQKKIIKRDQNIQARLRRISIDYQKIIQKEEDRLKKNPHYDKSMITNNSQNKSQTLNPNNKKDIEHCLLAIYLEKLHKQEDWERKYLNEFYDKLTKYIYDDYNKRSNQLDTILKEEKIQVNKQVRLQMKREADNIEMTETNRDTILILKEKSRQMNLNIGESTIHTLEEMYEQIKNKLHKNLVTNIDQLEKQRRIDRDKCVRHYSDRFNQLRIQLQCQMHNNQFDILHDNSLSSYRSPIITSASSSPTCYPSEIITQSLRRQTMPE